MYQNPEQEIVVISASKPQAIIEQAVQQGVRQAMDAYRQENPPRRSEPEPAQERRYFYRLADIVGNKKRGTPPLLPISRSGWYRGIQEGRFPKPINLTAHTVVWKAEDVDAIIRELQSRAEDAR